MSIKTIHAKVLEILLDERKTNKNFRFQLRRTNRFNRLANGYWFHGNDDYMAISFWSGMDWRNKTPNIFFVIWGDGYTKLEISVSDSEEKYTFIHDELLPALTKRFDLTLDFETSKDQHHYKDMGANYEASLRHFLANEKVAIDEVIAHAESRYYATLPPGNKIEFIREEDFQKHLAKTLSYRDAPKPPARSVGITQADIHRFGNINSTVSLTIPEGTRWIFLTGENGAGKTTILRALTLALHPPAVAQLHAEDKPQPYEIDISLTSNIDGVFTRSAHAAIPPSGMPAQQPILAFAAYGASRLLTYDHKTPPDAERSATAYSIFHHDAILQNLDRFLKTLANGSALQKERLENIKELLTDKELIPQLAKIELPDDGSEALYYEQDDSKEEYDSVPFRKLASGVKSLIAFLGDMLTRLFELQPDITDPTDLSGVVLIDEIDIHLHPAMQKKIVEVLSASFPNIQFIATTHSPITLLGASQNSIFYRVRRTRSDGVHVEQIDFDVKNAVSRLTPNIILTSPIFGMSEVFNSNIDLEKGELRTEDSWAAMRIFDRDLENLVKAYEERKKSASV